MRIRIEYPVLTSIHAEDGHAGVAIFRDSDLFEIPEHHGSEATAVAEYSGGPGGVAMVHLNGRLYSKIHETASSENLWKHRLVPVWDRSSAGRYGYPYSAVTYRYDKTVRAMRSAQGPDFAGRVYPRAAAAHLSNKSVKPMVLPLLEETRLQIDEDAVAEARMAMEDAASRLAIIGGSLWRECHAPFVLCHPDGREPSIDLWWSGPDPYFMSTLDRFESLQFGDLAFLGSADDVDGCFDRAASAMHAAGLAEDTPAMTPNHTGLRILEPYLVRSGGPVLGLLFCADRVAARMSENLVTPAGGFSSGAAWEGKMRRHVEKIDVAAFLACKNLLSELENADATGVGDGLAEALREAATYDLAYRNRRRDEMAMLAIEDALECWAARPVSLDIATGPRT